MIMKKLSTTALFLLLVLLIGACGDDSEDTNDTNSSKINNTTVYFPYQYPVYTLVLGDDIYDNSLDNAHKCRIWASMGGDYSGCKGSVDFIVDESLCTDVYFKDLTKDLTKVLPMPTNYYSLMSNVIPFNDESRGYVEVQLTDAFFNDPKSIEKTYVIPLRLTKATGIGHILTGTPKVGVTPDRLSDDWEILPKDYVLYCVKYMIPCQATYYRRGIDKVTNNSVTTVVTRKNLFDEKCEITTKNMTQAIFPVAFKTSGTSLSCNLILTFNGNTCLISTDDKNITAEGSGEFIIEGTARPEYKDYQWENDEGTPVQRDILRLSYTIDFTNENIKVETRDTLVVKYRDERLYFECYRKKRGN